MEVENLFFDLVKKRFQVFHMKVFHKRIYEGIYLNLQSSFSRKWKKAVFYGVQ